MSSMRAIGIIPARYGSTRFEGKVLAPLAGKSVIQHVWERASLSTLLETVIIACDDVRIQEAAKKFDAHTVLTRKDHASGSDRIAAVAESLDAEIIVNIQGDEPFIQPAVIDALVRTISEDKNRVMATVIKSLDAEDELRNPHIVKVAVDAEGNALYFSRSPIPHNRDGKPLSELRYYKHLGIYAYRREFLMHFSRLPRSYLEQVEQLEQLRALEAGYKIKTIQTDSDTIGIDTRDDLARAEAFLARHTPHE